MKATLVSLNQTRINETVELRMWGNLDPKSLEISLLFTQGTTNGFSAEFRLDKESAKRMEQDARDLIHAMNRQGVAKCGAHPSQDNDAPASDDPNAVTCPACIATNGFSAEFRLDKESAKQLAIEILHRL